MFKYLPIFALCVSLPHNLFAEEKLSKYEKAVGAIASNLSDCLEERGTGKLDYISCQVNTLDLYVQAINEEYKQLLLKINTLRKNSKNDTNKKFLDKIKSQLEKSQTEWIKYRDEQFKFLDNFYELCILLGPDKWYGHATQRKEDILKVRLKELFDQEDELDTLIEDQSDRGGI